MNFMSIMVLKNPVMDLNICYKREDPAKQGSFFEFQYVKMHKKIILNVVKIYKKTFIRMNLLTRERSVI